jgi:hypothetical protein
MILCIAGVSNAYAVTIDTAKWNSNKERLVLKGQDSPQSAIALFDADSGLPLATVKTNAAGNWVKIIDSVSSVPCKVRATSSNDQADAVVANAPADCAAPVLIMDTVKWNLSASTLLAFGYADTLNTVFLTDALTGAELGSAKASDDGYWRTKISGLTEIPCRVQASTEGTQVDASVRKAPANCSSSPLSPELAATIFADKQCDVCHGNDGSGFPGPDVSGEPASAIIRALAKEEVHAGITATSEEAEAMAAFLSDPSPLPLQQTAEFSDPETCRTCHPRQYKEWSGNIMAYSAVSPTFNALESLGNRFSVANDRPGFAAGSHGTALFCQSCHNPVDTFLGNFPTLADSNDQPMRDFASAVGRRGISCDVCHQISMPDNDDQGLGHLGDGVANVAYVLEPGATKFGPLDNPNPNPVHESAHAKDINMQNGYLDTGAFCATCHDVRTPPDSNLAVAVDPVTNEPFQRLENLFTEWQNGPFGPDPDKNRVGGVVTCQDCHMDVGPPAPAASYAEGETTVYPRPNQVQEREKVSTHYFTGVDIALVDFPGQDDEALDENGNVVGQVQRRRQLLESAATVSVTAPDEVTAGKVASVRVHVTNVGSGHNIPSGFSQERQMWVELIVEDANKRLYESGTLVDTAHPETGEMQGDKNLDDEDLQNLIGPDGGGGVIDPVTLEANVIHGPDYNQRHAHPPVYKGLANFGNEFIRIPTDGGVPRLDPTGHFVEEEVLMPFLSTHTDNSFSIPPLETEDVRYDVDIPADAVGPITVSARLRFRALPPRFLRALAQGRPDLVNEKMIDRNRIVEMTAADPVVMQVVLP